MKKKKSILVVIDWKDWVFDRLFKNLKKFIRSYDFTPYYLFEKDQPQFRDIVEDQDAILFLCDHLPERVFTLPIPHHKLILAVRSEVSHPMYSDKNNLRKITPMILTPNKALFERFKQIHPNVHLTPGGVDHNIFKPSEKKTGTPIRLGWAGSSDNFGSLFRGLEMMEEACKQGGFRWNPAIKEKKNRSQREMVDYYQNEIDIFIDLSRSAGRQNGLVEAASSGLPLISTDAGIARELIQEGQNGFIVERKKEDIIGAVKRIRENYRSFSMKSREIVEEQWTWSIQKEAFKEAFEQFFSENEHPNVSLKFDLLQKEWSNEKPKTEEEPIDTKNEIVTFAIFYKNLEKKYSFSSKEYQKLKTIYRIARNRGIKPSQKATHNEFCKMFGIHLDV